MSRFFEVVEVEEETPKFLVVGEGVIAERLVDNLLSGGAQVFYINPKTSKSHQNLYKLNSPQIENISKNIKYIFFEKDPPLEVETLIQENLPHAKYIYLNPKTLKENCTMIYTPLIYGPEIEDSIFGFIAYNLKNILEDQRLVLPENLTEKIKPVFIDDVIDNIEKTMFSPQNDNNQNLILFEGKEEIELATFFTSLISRLKIQIKTEYLDKKLVFKIPNAGIFEVGQMPIEKGIAKTADFLNKNLHENFNKLSEIISPIREESVDPQIPKNIPIVKNSKEQETEFAINNNFLKKVYSDNIAFLEKNSLISKKYTFKETTKTENSISKKINHLKKIIHKLKSIRLKKPHFKLRLPKPNKKIIVGFFSILGIIILPLFLFFLSFTGSLFFFKESGQALSVNDIKTSKTYVDLGEKTLSFSKFLHFKINVYYFVIFNKKNSHENISDLITLESDGFQIIKSISTSYQSLGETIKYVLNNKRETENNIDKSLQSTSLGIENARVTLSSVIGQLKNKIPHIPKFLWFIKPEYYTSIKKVPEFYQDLIKTDTFLKSIPEIIGKNDKKTYAVVFQNNMELRATGGFIGSFAMITFEKARLTDFSVFDVYDADGQLKGRVEPPPEILHYLGQPNWFLRDANVNPDFAGSAKQISWFLNKEIKSQIDGVVAIDISFVENLLKTTGPIYLPDFKETVSSSNLFEKAERASEINFFPGSTKKKDFLSVLSKTLWQKFLLLDTKKITEMLASFQIAGEQKHLQIFFENKELQELAKMFDVNGTLKETKGEYLDIVENNYGANKANYFIKRIITHTIAINSDGFVEHKVNVAYTNFSPLSLWPTGDYKPYIKFYINPDSIFKNFSLENKQTKLSEFLNEFVLENLKPKSEQLVLQGEENNKKYFGTFITIPVGKSKNITFSWQSQNADLKNLKNFNFYFQKQAGTVRDEYDLTVIYPQNLKAQSNIAPSVASKGEVQYNLNTEKDIDLNLKFEIQNLK